MSGSAAKLPSLPAPPLSIVLRLALVAAALLLLARSYAVDAVAALLPVIGAEIKALDDNITIGALEVAGDSDRDVVRLRANLLRPQVFEGQMIYPLGWKPNTNGWFQVRVSARGVLQSVLIFLAVVLAWPVYGGREFTLRAALALPFGALLFAIDTPADLLGNFQEAVVRRIDPQATTALFTWDRFLEGGGSAALALGFAVVAIGIAARIAKPKAARIPSAPESPGT